VKLGPVDLKNTEDFPRKYKAPNSKHQITNKFQAPITETYFGLRLNDKCLRQEWKLV